ncbi:deg-3, partial [Pristionchus pacificus]
RNAHFRAEVSRRAAVAMQGSWLSSLTSLLFLLATETEGMIGAGRWNETETTLYSDVTSSVVNQDELPLIRLTRDILSRERYDKRVRPVYNHKKTLPIHISISLYQIIEVGKYQDEPSQNIKLNVWMIQRWKDEFLYWNPQEYGGIDRTVLPYNVLWIPDTYLYNSVRMARDETERYMNIQVETLHEKGENASQLSFLYPAIYTLTCRLNIRYFPYDQQNCTLTISSWTNSKSALDYYADPTVNLASFIPNEEWQVVKFDIYRHEYKYACCEEPWVIIQASLVIRRKPLYYLVNLIIPTSIITIVAITGFFTPASTDDDRTEKINLGITTLLAMSILMLMVSDQMPTTSEFVPLIGWFYLSIIIIISIGTFLTSVILSIQGRRQYGRCPPRLIRQLFFVWLTRLLWLDVPLPLKKLWEEMDDNPRKPRPLLRKTAKGSGKDLENNNLTIAVTNIPDRPPSRVGTLRLPPLPVPAEKRGSIQMIDHSVPASPLIRSSRQGSMWDGAINALGTGASMSRGLSIKSNREKPIDQMKKQRQVSLEWEFLATILDRILLIAFVCAVCIITLGLMVVGKMAQFQYDKAQD